MAFLEKFTDEEKELLVSMPFIAGAWISQADDTGGAVSEYKEQKTLEHIIEEKSSGLFESAFVHEVMHELNERRADWENWGKNTENFLNDCEKLVALLSKKATEHDAGAYKENMMFIATEVALAYREFDRKADFFKKIWTYLLIAIDSLIGVAKRETYHSKKLLNVSLEEDLALAKLVKAIRYGESATKNE